jgi:hypothetical protein
MTFATACLFKYLLSGPIEITEVVCEKNTGKKRRGAGSAAHPERDFVVEFEVKTRGENAGVRQHIDISGEDKIIFDPRTEEGIPARGVDLEQLCWAGIDREVEGHGETQSIEAWAEVRGGGGKAKVERLALDWSRLSRGSG